jgi:hypothetical protein
VLSAIAVAAGLVGDKLAEIEEATLALVREAGKSHGGDQA